MDGFIHVVRCFTDVNVPHPGGSIDPQRDVVTMESELLLNDLIAVERKLERLAEERHKGGTDRTLNERQTAVFERLQSLLSNEIPLREVEISHDEDRLLSGFGLLSRKPILVLLILGEGQPAPQLTLLHSCPLVALQGKLEMEIAQLSQEDAAVFMKEYGIEELFEGVLDQHVL